MPPKVKDETLALHDLPDDPVEIAEEPLEETATVSTPAPKQRTKIYIFPDIDGGGPSVKIEATSIEEAQELLRKGHA